MWRELDAKLRSPRLAIVLILFLAFAATAGTFPPQFFVKASEGHLVARALLAIGADHLFATLWFQAALAALGLLMAYASVRRVPAVVRALAYLPEAALWEQESELVSTTEIVVDAGRADFAQARLLHALHDRGYRSRTVEQAGDRSIVLLDKGRLGVFGSPFVHVGMLIVLCGGLITHAFGHIDDIMVGEGATYALPNSEASIRLGKFSIVHHPNRREPEEYVSTLIVSDADGERGWHLLRVNQPLSVAGLTLYQMRYWPDVRAVVLDVLDAGGDAVLASVEASPDGSRVPLGGDLGYVAVDRVVPDFAIGPDKGVYTRSEFFMNPAARVAVYATLDAEKPVETAWAFHDTLQTHRSGEGRLSFRIRRLRIQYFSGIKVVRDPGMIPAYLGFVLLIAGAFISSYVYQRFLRVEFDRPPGQGQMTVHIAGFTRRHQPEFALEWRSLSAQLQKLLGEK